MTRLARDLIENGGAEAPHYVYGDERPRVLDMEIEDLETVRAVDPEVWSGRRSSVGSTGTRRGCLTGKEYGMDRIYYAHPVSDYGTRRESAGVRLLTREGWWVENPNQPHHATGYAREGMEYFRGVVRGCDAVAFQRFPDGTLGAGVAREASWALEDGKPVFEVVDGRLVPRAEVPAALSVEETRERVRRFRSRAIR